ncbi:MAG: hypothetical protein N7Q72_03685 [Spiroplasma sp. Tabriz.8]|nr:hypothetical protein [Spiroplasma sp. Tabriz.8]
MKNIYVYIYIYILTCIGFYGIYKQTIGDAIWNIYNIYIYIYIYI